MTVFGDYEPEDAWDPDDDPAVQLENLRRRVRVLYAARTIPRLETLELVALAVVIARARDDLEPRDSTRIDDLLDDIAHVARRVADG